YGRARLEWQAYRETLRAVAESEGIEAARDPKLHAHIVARFVGPDYAWMWPFPRAVQRGVPEALAEIQQNSSAPREDARYAGRPARRDAPAPPRRTSDRARHHAPRSAPRAHRRERDRVRCILEPRTARGLCGLGALPLPRERRSLDRSAPSRRAEAG